MNKEKSRSIVLGLAACGLLTWLPPSLAHGLGGGVGAGIGAGAQAGGTLMGRPSVALGSDVRMDATSSIRADSGSLRSKADRARQAAKDDVRTGREHASATAEQASDFGQSTAAAARQISGQADAAADVAAAASTQHEAPRSSNAEANANANAHAHASASASRTGDHAAD